MTEELGPRRNKKFVINKHGSGAAFKRKKKMVYNGGRRTLCPIQSDTKINYAASRLQGAVHNVGRSVLYGALFLVANPFHMANFRVSAHALPKANS